MKDAAVRFRDQINSGQLRILNVGIAADEGALPFWICETHSEWSSFDRDVASRDGCPHHEVVVPCRRFGSILEEFGIPFYSKIDIEGNDLLCLQDLNRQRLPKFISVEMDDRLGALSSLDLLSLMAERGYNRFKAIDQVHFLPIELPPSPEQRHYERTQWMRRSRNPLIRVFRRFGGRYWLSRQRRRGDWTFPLGSSGLFGEELLGRWLSHNELADTIKHMLYLKEQKRPSLFWDDREYSFWVDFHGRTD
jgi:hypothetical protein